MSMTHYMELLATNQPWNLILFMAIPVILAETVAVTELFILFGKNTSGTLKSINKVVGILGGTYFIVVFFYLLFNAAIPLTLAGEWRGIADFIAVGFYLAGIIPLGGILLLELNVIFRKKSKEEKLKTHAVFVAIFLVTAHIAMIAGMLNPEVTGWKNTVEAPVQMEMKMEM